LTNNKTEAEVEQLIDSTVCSLLGSLEDECKTLVHEFMPEIMEMLSGYYDPTMICQSLGVCSGNLAGAKSFLLLARLQKLPLYQKAKQLGSDESCMMCKIVMTELQALDRSKAVQTEVLDVLKNKLCAVAGPLKEICQNTVDSHGSELFELIVTILDPMTRCRFLGFCVATSLSNSIPMVDLTPAKPAKSEFKIKESPTCILCEFVITQLQKMIGENATEEEIMEALETVCTYMPESLKSECKDFVDTYGPAVIKMLIQELNPTEVCQELKLCDQSAAVPPHKPLPTQPISSPKPKVGDTGECAICETIVQYLEALVEQNATMAEIEAVLEKICGYFPDSMSKQCDAIVEQYGPMIIHYISVLESPKQLCTLIGLCDAKKSNKIPELKPGDVEEKEVKQKVPITGENECSWGPAYWCATRENAERCNAVDHCKTKVWNKK
jgi:saposin